MRVIELIDASLFKIIGSQEAAGSQTAGGSGLHYSGCGGCVLGNHSTTRGPNASYAFDIDVDLRCLVFA